MSVIIVGNMYLIKMVMIKLEQKNPKPPNGFPIHNNTCTARKEARHRNFARLMATPSGKKNYHIAQVC